MSTNSFVESKSIFSISQENKWKIKKHAEVHLKTIHDKVIDHIDMKQFLEPPEVPFLLKRLNKLVIHDTHLEQYRANIKTMLLNINSSFNSFEKAICSGEVSLHLRKSTNNSVSTSVVGGENFLDQSNSSDKLLMSSIELTNRDFKTLSNKCRSKSSSIVCNELDFCYDRAIRNTVENKYLSKVHEGFPEQFNCKKSNRYSYCKPTRISTFDKLKKPPLIHDYKKCFKQVKNESMRKMKKGEDNRRKIKYRYLIQPIKKVRSIHNPALPAVRLRTSESIRNQSSNIIKECNFEKFISSQNWPDSSDIFSSTNEEKKDMDEQIFDKISVLLSDIDLKEDVSTSQDLFVSPRDASISQPSKFTLSSCNIPITGIVLNSAKSKNSSKSQIVNTGFSTNLMAIDGELICNRLLYYNDTPTSREVIKLNKNESEVSFNCKQDIHDLSEQLAIANLECLEVRETLKNLLNKPKSEIINIKMESSKQKNEEINFPKGYEHHYEVLDQLILEHRSKFGSKQKYCKELEQKMFFEDTMKSWQELQIIINKMRKKSKRTE